MHPYPPTHCHLMFVTIGWYRTHTSAPSIFRANRFGRWVITHSLADFNFHDHRPAVHIDQHPLWYLISKQFSASSKRKVHPSSQILLTKTSPHGNSNHPASSIKQLRVRTHLKFENWSKTACPRVL